MAVELSVTHHTIVANTLQIELPNISSSNLPAENPEAPFARGWAMDLADRVRRGVVDHTWHRMRCLILPPQRSGRKAASERSVGR